MVNLSHRLIAELKQVLLPEEHFEPISSPTLEPITDIGPGANYVRPYYHHPRRWLALRVFLSRSRWTYPLAVDYRRNCGTDQINPRSRNLMLFSSRTEDFRDQMVSLRSLTLT